MPAQIGPWQGRDQELPRAAVELLKPNALRMRTYTHMNTQREVSLLIVHCKDARDLLGHYPPNCYPAAGWQQQNAEPITWTLGDRTIKGMRYLFQRPQRRSVHRTVVLHFMVSPRGRFVRRIRGLWDAAADPRRRFYGAAQVQCLMPAAIDKDRRRAIFGRLLQANAHVLTALQSSEATGGSPPGSG
jgi:EpsI family protein